MSDQTVERPPAETIRELDIHLRYMQGLLESVRMGMQTMATTKDIKQLNDRMDNFVTRDKFEALETKFEALGTKVESGTVSNAFDRTVTLLTKLGAAGAVLVAFAGAIVALVHYLGV